MPFVVTTTHTIPDDAPVTADMLSAVLRPSRWAGLPDGTASTARVDFVAARPVEPGIARNREAAAATVLREADVEPNILASYLASCDAILELNRNIVSYTESLLSVPNSFRHPRDFHAAFRG